MQNIIGVRFRKTGKIYFFNPNGINVNLKDHVIVETSQGEEFGEVLISNRAMPDEKIIAPLKKVIRVASKSDEKRNNENKEKEKKAFNICLEKIKEHNLDMKLIEVEYKFDNSKILFYFSAEGRIDFRDLVKDLAAIFKTRIELRQIGVRDEVKRIGGNGVCGRELCCCSFLNNFETVSIKMAKEQNISLTPSKISGNCGRLMCCLKYEQDVYEEKLKKLPGIGAIVKTNEGIGEVYGLETLKEIVKVKIKDKDSDDVVYKKYSVKDITVIKDTDKKEVSEENPEDEEELKKLED